MRRSNLYLAAFSAVAVLCLGAIVPFANRPNAPAPRARKATEPVARAASLPIARDKMGQSLLPLLNNELIQAELGISELQRGRIEAIADQCLTELAPALSAVQGSGTGSARTNHTDRLAAFQVAQANLLTRNGSSAVDVLSESQKKRLDEVLFRLRSVEVYEMPEFVTSLGLREEQRTAIRSVIAKLQKEATALHEQRSSGKIAVADFNREVGAALRRAEVEVIPLLNATQQAVVAQWSGDPLPFTRQDLSLVIRKAGPQLTDAP